MLKDHIHRYTVTAMLTGTILVECMVCGHKKEHPELETYRPVGWNFGMGLMAQTTSIGSVASHLTKLV